MEDFRESGLKDILQSEEKLKIVHFSHWTPGLSGLANATFDQVICERRAGLKSHFVDAYTKEPVDLVEREIKASPWSEALDADIWVLHKMIPQELLDANKKLEIPIIAVLHGSVQDMFMQTFLDDSDTDWWNLQINLLNQFDASVCVCPFDYQVNQLYIKDPKKLHFIREGVDPLRFSPEGDTMHFRYHPALMSKDTLRPFKYPYFTLWSMPKVIEKIPTARLNLFSLHLIDMCKWRNFFLRSNRGGNLRHTIETLNMIGFFDIAPFIRGCDITINNDYFGSQSRTAPESLMCGKPVVAAGQHNDYTPYTFTFGDSASFADAIESCWNDLQNQPNEVKETCLEFANEHFNLQNNLTKWIKLYQDILNG